MAGFDASLSHIDVFSFIACVRNDHDSSLPAPDIVPEGVNALIMKTTLVWPDLRSAPILGLGASS